MQVEKDGDGDGVLWLYHLGITKALGQLWKEDFLQGSLC